MSTQNTKTLGLFTLIALAFVSVPFFLLLNKEARAYFRAMGAGSRTRGTRKRATPNGGMRGRKV